MLYCGMSLMSEEMLCYATMTDNIEHVLLANKSLHFCNSQDAARMSSLTGIVLSDLLSNIH